MGWGGEKPWGEPCVCSSIFALSGMAAGPEPERRRPRGVAAAAAALQNPKAPGAGGRAGALPGLETSETGERALPPPPLPGILCGRHNCECVVRYTSGNSQPD